MRGLKKRLVKVLAQPETEMALAVAALLALNLLVNPAAKGEEVPVT